MGVVIPNGFGVASFVFSVMGKTDDLITTIGYQAGSDFNEATAASFIRQAWSDTGRPFAPAALADVYTFRGVRCTRMTTTGPIGGESMVSLPGATSYAVLPPNCAFLVRKGTARGGRKGRGRMFLPAGVYSEGGVDSAGMIANTFAPAFNVKLEAARAAMVTSGYKAMLLHEDGSAPDEITNLSLQAVLATQRRRLR